MKSLENILPICVGGEDIDVPTNELAKTIRFLKEHNLFYEEIASFPARLLEYRKGLFKKIKEIEGVGKMELLTEDDFEFSHNIICVTCLSVANTKEELEERERLR